MQSFELNINNKTNIFNTFIYKGEINIINCSLKEDNIETHKCYEIIYLSKKDSNLPKEINISGYTIKDFDKFSCTNRIRFNVMNVPKDNKIYKFNDNLSSYEIIYQIDENNKTKKYGIFDLTSYNKKQLKDFIINSKYSEFVKKFYEDYNQNNGKNYKENINYYINKTKELNCPKEEEYNFLKESNKYVSYFTKESLDKDEVFIYFRNYFFYYFFYIMYRSSQRDKIFVYTDFLKIIDRYDNYNKIKILSGFINIIKNFNIIPRLVDIKNLNKDDPYSLAIELQKNIIENLTEKSNIFYPILQFNSKILKIIPDNYFSLLKEKLKKFFKINDTQNYAYTISLESIEKIKSHLKSVEDDFFFVFDEFNNYNFYGLFNKYSKTTLINQYNLCFDIGTIQDLNKKKDYAFSINMILLLERMCHVKESLNNEETNLPCIFFNIDFEKDYIYSSYSNNKENESARIMEKFVAHQLIINIMKKNKKFGKYLDYKYFIGDFHEIIEEALKEIKNDSQFKEIRNKKFLKIIIELSMYILIISSIYFNRNYFNYIFIISLLLFISIIFLMLFINDLKIYRNPLINNEIYYDITDENINNTEKLLEHLIYPDDYPFESETFLGRYFPFLEFKKNKIRQYLSKYVTRDGNYY